MHAAWLGEVPTSNTHQATAVVDKLKDTMRIPYLSQVNILLLLDELLSAVNTVHGRGTSILAYSFSQALQGEYLNLQTESHQVIASLGTPTNYKHPPRILSERRYRPPGAEKQQQG